MSLVLPKLRFPSFNAEYVETSFSECTERTSIPVKVESDKLYTQIGIRSHNKGVFYKTAVTGRELGNKKVFWVQPEHLVINIVFAWEQAVAMTDVEQSSMIASHRFPMYKPTPENDLGYLNYFFATKRGKHFLTLASPGGAGRNKTLNQKDLQSLPINLPCKSEQTKIRSMLASVDERSRLLVSKLDLTKEYRKGIVQSLFSKKIRFKDKNGNAYPEWTYEAIGKFLEPYKEVVSSDTELPILTSSRTGLYLQKRSVSNDGHYGVLPLGYFTYRHMSDDSIFKFNLNNKWERGAVSKEYPVFRAVDLDSYFLEFQLNEGSDFKRFAIQQKQGGTRTRLYFNNLKELHLHLPCLEEQNRISEFLQAIDTKIEAIEDQIEKNSKFKEGLLQQMFV